MDSGKENPASGLQKIILSLHAHMQLQDLLSLGIRSPNFIRRIFEMPALGMLKWP